MSKTLVHQITSGVAGWLTYEQMRGGVDNLTVASLYKPIEEIAKGRRFFAWAEFPIPKLPKMPGSPKEVDYVIIDPGTKAVLALEVKYFKSRKIKMAGSITRDARKLMPLSIDEIEAQRVARRKGTIRVSVDGFALTKAVLIVWRHADIHRLGEIRDRTYEDQQHRASGLNLVVTAIILWNTRYLERAVATLRRTEDVPDHFLAHLSPLG